jgi:anti-anti-sigma factor
LQVQLQNDPNATVVTLDGEMDTHTAPRVTEALEGVFAAPVPMIVIDAAELRFLDSSGISELLRLRQRALDAGGSLRLRAASPAVRRVIEITGLVDVLGLE